MRSDNRMSDDSLLVWASFVAGHHGQSLMNWQCGLWSVRGLIAEGRLEPDKRLPLQVSEFVEAHTMLLGHLDMSRREVLRAGRCLERWQSAAATMLDELQNWAWAGCVYDWSSDIAPGYQEMGSLLVQSERAVADSSHLRGWFRFGEELAEEWHSISTTAAGEIADQLDALHREGPYGFIPPLTEFLRECAHVQVVAKEHAIVEPSLGRPSLPRLVVCLKRQLRRAGPPQPLVILWDDAVDFFGRRFARLAFRSAEWAILKVLLARRKQRCFRQDLLEAASLTCNECGLAPHIARLRQKLKPAILAHYRGHSLPENADKCFIVSLRGENGSPYILDLDSHHIRYEPRPAPKR